MVERYGQDRILTQDCIRAFERAELAAGGLVLMGLSTGRRGTGLSLPGRVGAVIVEKLPFAPPGDLLTKAMEQAFGVSYFGVQLPLVVRILRQNFGRGIRKSSDQADLYLLDPRAKARVLGEYGLADIGHLGGEVEYL